MSRTTTRLATLKMTTLPVMIAVGFLLLLLASGFWVARADLDSAAASRSPYSGVELVDGEMARPQ